MNRQTMIWIGLGFILLGGGLVGMGQYISSDASKLLAEGETTQATVVRKVVNGQGSHRRYTVELSIDEAPGAVLREELESSRWNLLVDGSKYTITYLPTNPEVFLDGDKRQVETTRNLALTGRNWGAPFLITGILSFLGGCLRKEA